MKKMYSVTEILELNLPALPKSKPAVTTKARKEGWKFAEETGLGGVRRLYEIPARYLVTVETLGLPMDTAIQAALQAHKAAQAMGGITDDQFIKMFVTLCGIDEKPQRQSMCHNTGRATAGKRSQVILGDGNVQIGKGDNKE